jgi:hypothetical protein
MYPAAIATHFTRYAELDAPCSIEASVLPGPGAGRTAVLVTGHQEGETVFSSTVTASSRRL